MSDQKDGMASDDVEVLRVRCSALGDSPAEQLVRRLLWDLSPPGREPTDEAWAKVSTREVKILAAAVVSLGALRAPARQAERLSTVAWLEERIAREMAPPDPLAAGRAKDRAWLVHRIETALFGSIDAIGSATVEVGREDLKALLALASTDGGAGR